MNDNSTIKSASFKLSAPQTGYYFVFGLLSFFILLGVIIVVVFTTSVIFEEVLMSYSSMFWAGIFIFIPTALILKLYRSFSWKRILNIKNGYLELINPKRSDETVNIPLKQCAFNFFDYVVYDSEPTTTRIYKGPAIEIKSNDFKILIVTKARNVHWRVSEGDSRGSRYSLLFDDWLFLMKVLGLKDKLA